jgi:hypothetical protein
VAFQQHENGGPQNGGHGGRGGTAGAERRWITVRQAADHVGRSVDWVRRQYRSGTVDSRIQTGRHGPERLVDVDMLEAAAETPKTAAPRNGATPEVQLPVLAETLHELAHQLGEAQERAARAEADAEDLRRRLTEIEQAQTEAEAEGAEAEGAEADADAEPAAEADPPAVVEAANGHSERDDRLWIAANRHYLRTLPGAAAREAAGARLTGGRTVGDGKRRWWPR